MTSPAAPDGQALVVEHLTKNFGSRVAFEDVSFTVAYGEVFGFLGPNGAGKTTTVRTLGALIAPTSGTAVVAGLELTPHNGERIRQRISIMPEVPGVYTRLTVQENLELAAELYELSEPGRRIREALEAVRLVDRAGDTCGSLSKGLRQRVGIARALLNEATILFLDEPTAGLDPVAARQVHESIDALRLRGVTIFLTTHRLEEAERLCDRVAILNTSLRSIGRPQELRAQLFSQSLAVRLRAPLANPEATLATVPGVTGWQATGDAAYRLSVSDPNVVAPELVRQLVAAGADVIAVAESQHSLEDVYLELVNEDVEGRTS